MLTLALTARADSSPYVLQEARPAAESPFWRSFRRTQTISRATFFDHEVEAQTQDHSLWSYRETKREDGKLKLYDVYQTRQGEIERLVAVGGRPIDGRPTGQGGFENSGSHLGSVADAAASEKATRRRRASAQNAAPISRCISNFGMTARTGRSCGCDFHRIRNFGHRITRRKFFTTWKAS